MFNLNEDHLSPPQFLISFFLNLSKQGMKSTDLMIKTANVSLLTSLRLIKSSLFALKILSKNNSGKKLFRPLAFGASGIHTHHKQCPFESQTNYNNNNLSFLCFHGFACLQKFMFGLDVSTLLTFEGYKTCYGTLLSDLSDINKVLNK